jgi:hypothetical protein
VSLEVGRFWGKYQIVSEIGQGGAGVVYLAVDPALDRNVALKLLNLNAAGDVEFQERIHQEAKIAATFTHPNIVHIHSFDVIDSQPYIEMEYIDGGSLATRLRERVVTVYETLRYAHQICKALAYCHSRGGIHRDVKPENILIQADGTAKLADFGLAKIFSETYDFSSGTTATGIFKGTPNYAPPEAWEGQRPTNAWDTYGLGVVIYRCLTGELPYPGNSPLEIARHMVAGPCKPLRSIAPRYSEELSSLLDRMLESDPSARLADCTDIINLIEQTPEWNDVGRISDAATMEGRIAFESGRDWSASNRTFGTAQISRRVVMAVLLVVAIFAGAFGFLGTGTAAPGKPTKQELNLGMMKDLNRVDSTFAITFEPVAEYPQESWSFGPPNELGEMDLYGVGTASFCVGQLVPLSENRYQVEGGWARILDAHSTGFRSGTFSGTVRIDWRIGTVVGVLNYATDQDGHYESKAIMGDKIADPENPFSVIEESEFLMPLMYRELLPRNMGWVKNLESKFPGFENGRYGVTELKTDGNSASIDGVLDESGWALVDRLSPDGDLLHGSDSMKDSAYFQMYAKSGFLHFAVVIPKVLQCGSSPNFEMKIVPAIDAPVSISPYIRLQSNGEGGVTSRVISREGVPSVISGVDLATRMESGRWVAEGRISLEALGASEIQFTPSTHWRGDLLVVCGEMTNENVVIEHWGFKSDPEFLRHGFMLEMPEGIF